VRPRWPGLLAALLGSLALGACTATPITLPFAEGGPGMRDAGGYDAQASSDTFKAFPDLDQSQKTDLDATSDSVCLECPLPDGLTDADVGDAEAGPAADAQTDFFVGDLRVGE